MSQRSNAVLTQRGILRIVLIYAAVAAIWIVFSDKAVDAFIHDRALRLYVDTAKGWLFIAITSFLLYALLYRFTRPPSPVPLQSSATPATRAPNWPTWTLYALAVTLSLATLILRQSFPVSMSVYPMMIMMMFPIIISAILGGFGPGILATAIMSLVTGYHVWLALTGSGPGSEYKYLLLQWIFLVANGGLTSLLAELMRSAWRHGNRALADRVETMQLMAAVVENSSDVIFAKDTEGRYILFNQAAGIVVGKKPESMLGMDDFAAFLPDQAEEMQRRDQQVLADGKTNTAEQVIQTANGPRSFLVTKGVLRDRRGIITGLFGIARDITERKAAESALQESQQRLQMFIEHAPAALAMFDQEMRYLAVSNRWISDFHLGDSVLLGRTQYEIFPEIPDYWKDIHRRALAGETIVASEDAFRRMDGSIQWLRWEVRPWHKSGSQIGGIVIFSEDISERKQAQEEQFRLSEALRQTAQPMLMCDLNGNILYANTAFIDLMGYSQEELTGVNLTLFVPEDDAHQQEYLALSRTLRDTGRWSGEVERLTKDGRLIPIFASGSHIRGLSDNIERFVITYSDLRPLKEKTQQLAESEARYRELFEASPHPMWVFDTMNFTFLAVNDSAIKHYGYSRDEFMRMTIKDIRPTEDIERLGAAVAQIPSGTYSPGIWRHCRKDGSIILVEVVAHPINYGNRQAAIVLANDVTQRLMAEQQLRKLSRAIEQSPQSVIITDLDSRFEYVNDAFTKTTGYERAELMGQKVSLLASGKTPHSTHEMMWATLSQDRTWKGEFINKRKDGSEYVDFATISPIHDESGRISHYVAIQEDVTDQKKLADELDQHRYHLAELVELRTNDLAKANQTLLEMQEELARRAQKAEAANLAKSYFLANMSHEIRTPMNAILGMAHILKRSPLNDEQRQRLAMLSHAGEHLLAMLNDILDLSKIEAGKMALECADIRVASLLDGVRSLIAPDAKRKNLTIEVECDRIPTYLKGDPTRLRQALLNYASNAVKFTSRGKVLIKASLLAETDDEVVIRFSVEDTGIGIAPEKFSELFKSFQQVDASTTRKHGGTGLGLAITQRLAELMGGQVGVISKPGEGSTFWFTAHCKRGTATTAPPPLEYDVESAEFRLQQEFASARILLVEDDPTNQEVAVSLLATTGFTIDIADNGFQALQKMAEHRYDLILMDMHMPGMDGVEATLAIRQLPDWQNIPILAMTANVFGEDMQRCLEAGMNDFVPKPVDPKILYSAILRWLENPSSLPTRPVTDADIAAQVQAEPEREPPLQTHQDEGPNDLDLSVLTRNLGNNPPTIARIVTKFIDTTRTEIAKMDTALAAEDWETLRALGHRLKSSSRTVGASGLGDLFETLERCHIQKNKEQASGTLFKIHSLFSQIEKGLENQPLLKMLN